MRGGGCGRVGVVGRVIGGISFVVDRRFPFISEVVGADYGVARTVVFRRSARSVSVFVFLLYREPVVVVFETAESIVVSLLL